MNRKRLVALWMLLGFVIPTLSVQEESIQEKVDRLEKRLAALEVKKEKDTQNKRNWLKWPSKATCMHTGIHVVLGGCIYFLNTKLKKQASIIVQNANDIKSHKDLLDRLVRTARELYTYTITELSFTKKGVWTNIVRIDENRCLINSNQRILKKIIAAGNRELMKHAGRGCNILSN